MGAWRYTTNLVTCLREWRWYDRVGLPEVAHQVIACGRAGALLAPLLPAVPMIPPAWAALPAAPWAETLPFPGGGGAAYAPASGRGGSWSAPVGATPVPRLSAAGRGDLAALAPHDGVERGQARSPVIPGGGVPLTIPPPADALIPLPLRPDGRAAPPASPVPEPASLALLGVALMVWGLFTTPRRR